MTNQIEHASKSDELMYLLRLVSVQMSLLGDSGDKILSSRRNGLPIAQCRFHLHGLRGASVVKDFYELSKNTARIATLMKEIEVAEASTTATQPPSQ